MEKAEIGLIGLGVMGSNLALNIAEKGHRIAVFNRTPSRTDAFVESAGALRERDHSLPQHRRARRRDPAAAPDHHHGAGRQAGRRADRAAAPRACRATTSSSTPAMPISATRCAASPNSTAPGSPSSAWAFRAARRARATARRSWSAARADSYARVESVLTAIAAKYQGRALLRLARRRRRRAFRQDHPQRHRICRHADDRRDLRRAARRPRHAPEGDRRGVRRLEQGPAQLLPDRDHGRGAGRRRPARPASRWSR